jgi:hypothetical protein
MRYPLSHSNIRDKRHATRSLRGGRGPHGDRNFWGLPHVGVSAIAVALGRWLAFATQAPIVIKPAIVAKQTNAGAGQAVQGSRGR